MGAHKVRLSNKKISICFTSCALRAGILEGCLETRRKKMIEDDMAEALMVSHTMDCTAVVGP